jgi:hypothetical protein
MKFKTLRSLFMENTMKKIATIIVTSAALAVASAPLTSVISYAHGKVKCYGVSTCKCKTAHKSCKGKSTCDEKGMVMMKSAAACKKQGGSTTAPASTTDTDKTVTTSTNNNTATSNTNTNDTTSTTN